MEIRRIGQIKDRDEVVGNQTRVKVVKNKLAPPFRQVEFDIMYGEGISKVGELIDLGVKAGVVEKSGAWFSYDSQRIGQGRENAKQFLLDHPDIYNAIEAKVLAHHNVRRIGIDVASEAAVAASPVDDKASKPARPSAPSQAAAPAASSSPATPPPNGKRPNA
jgi:recombination protein RecA